MSHIKHLLQQLKHRAFLARTDVQKIRQARRLRQDSEFAQQLQNIQKRFELPALPYTSGIWAVAMVKNEQDVIVDSIEHLYAQGINQILVVDNLSTDSTYELLQELSQRYPLIVGRDHEPAYYQSAKMTVLSDLALAHGAQWVVPFDADEFWYGTDGTLAEVLQRCAHSSGIMQASIHNQFPQPDGTWLIDTQAHHDVKVAFKPTKYSVVQMGNHAVLRPGVPETKKLMIVHRPWRSLEQFTRKIRQGARSLELTNLPQELGYHWRVLGESSDAELEELWNKLVTGQEVPEVVAWRPKGELATLSVKTPQRWSEISKLLS
ncbi:glycosyltransferase family 2 protein [Rothia sp. P6271]|uniref:glycosyltransferase family 2 protein n=1 Tax=Rothia sp. P6271 TaxID=3402659 RepID=UPI003AC57BD3